jgi:hypothetical protein
MVNPDEFTAHNSKISLNFNRIEPLVCEDYIGNRPVLIPYHKGGKRLHIGFQVELFNNT